MNAERQKQKTENDLNENQSSNRKEKSSVLKKLFLDAKDEKDYISEEETLQEIFKDAGTGAYAIEVLRPYIKDRTFKNLLYRQYNEYRDLLREIQHRATDLGYEMQPLGAFMKGMMFAGTFVNTIADRSVNKLAQLMIQGNNMGVINCVKLINALESDGIIQLDLVHRALTMYQNNINDIKPYL